MASDTTGTGSGPRLDARGTSEAQDRWRSYDAQGHPTGRAAIRQSRRERHGVHASTRYTPPVTSEMKAPKPWVPVLMVALFIVGMIVIILRNLVFTRQQLAHPGGSGMHSRWSVHGHQVAITTLTPQRVGSLRSHTALSTSSNLHRCDFPQSYPQAGGQPDDSVSRTAARRPSISSRQCFGGGGSSSGASVNFSSTPQTSQRYLMFTFRSSPGSGGGTGGAESACSIAMPIRHSTTISTQPESEPHHAAHRHGEHHEFRLPGYPQGLWAADPAARPDGSRSSHVGRHQPSRSMIVAFAIPPPSHIVCRP